MTTPPESEAPEPEAVAPEVGRRRPTATIAQMVAVGLLVALVAGGVWLMARPEPGGVEHTIDIPAGTGERIDRGEPVELVPAELVVAVNDSIVIENHDDRTHRLGPFVVAADETLVHQFDRPGRFEGACELHPDDSFAVIAR